MTTSTKSPVTVTPGSADGPNKSTNAAVHHDLYRVKPDPGAERKELRGQARVLGLGFLVFFTGILGLLSLSLNGLWSANPRLALSSDALPPGIVPNPADEGSDYLLEASPFYDHTFTWSSGQTSYAGGLGDEASEGPTQTLQRALGDQPAKRRVDVVVDRHVIGSVWVEEPEGLAEGALVTWATLDTHRVPVLSGPAHAITHAKLAGVLPTKVLMGIGALMGFLALAVPGLLIPFYKFWMRYVTAPLGWFNTRLILSIVFYAMFTPMGLWFAMRRALWPETDSLRRTPHEGSYWVTRDKQRGRKHYERLF
jgi:hypothetical protein